MNPTTEISPSTQFLLDEMHRMFDEADARWDRRFARLQEFPVSSGPAPPSGRAPSSCNDDSSIVPVGALVTITDEPSSDPARAFNLTSEEPVRITEERDYEPPLSDSASPLPMAEQLTVDTAATECTSIDLAAPPDPFLCDGLSLLPDALIRNIVSRLPVKDASRTAVLSRRRRLLWRAAPTVSLAQIEAPTIFFKVQFKQDAVQDLGCLYELGTSQPLVNSLMPPPLPSRCSTLCGNRVECTPEVRMQFVHECAADTERAQARPGCARLRRLRCGIGALRSRARPRRARLRHHRCTFGALRLGAPWVRCVRTVFPKAAHCQLMTSTSAALVVCNITEASTAAASTRVKDPVTTSTQFISIINATMGPHWVLDEVFIRYITNVTPAHLIGVVMPCSTSETHGQSVFEGQLAQNVVELVILGDSVQCQTIPCSSNPNYAVQVHLTISKSTNSLWQSLVVGLEAMDSCTDPQFYHSFREVLTSLLPLHLSEDLIKAYQHGSICNNIGLDSYASSIHSNCRAYAWFKIIGQLLALVIPTHSVQLKRGGLTQFDSHFHELGISCWGLLADMRPISPMVLLLLVFGHSADMLVLVGILDWCRSPKCFKLLSSIWPVKKKRQLLGSSAVLNLEGYSSMNMLTFELHSLSMLLIQYTSVHVLPSALVSILASLKGSNLKLEVLVLVYKFNSNSMLWHQFSTTVQAPPVGVRWVLLEIDHLAHEEFQFDPKIKQLVGSAIIQKMIESSCNLLAMVDLINEGYCQGDVLITVPLQQPASVEFTDDVFDDLVDDDADDDYEHEAKDTILTESTMQHAAAPPTPPKGTGRIKVKRNKKQQVLAQFPWDPGGFVLLHRLEGKPKLKKGGMLGLIHGWAIIWALGLGRGQPVVSYDYKSAGAVREEASNIQKIIHLHLPVLLPS